MITIKPTELEAVSLASSTEQTRYYLNGVCIEVYADKTIGMIATDGHRMHTINTQEAPVSSYIIASADVKKALQMAKAEEKALGRHTKNNVMIKPELIETVLNVSVVLVDKDGAFVETKGMFTTKPIDGSFPDWRRVLPNAAEPLAHSDLCFNCVYMADFGKADKILSGNKSQSVQIISSGRESPILVKLPHYPAFTGVLMPMRA